MFDNPRKRPPQQMSSADPAQVINFWDWFISVSDELRAGGESGALMTQLDDRLSEIHRGLIWEICPGGLRPRQLTISPNLDPVLRNTAQEIVFAAPVLAHWEFYATRQPKEWNYKIHVGSRNGNRIELDVSDWVFLLLQCLNGKQQVLLSCRKMPLLTANQRWQAGADVLCNLLGEDLVMDRIKDFEFGCGFQSLIAEWTSIRLLDAAIQNLQLCMPG